MKSIQDPPNTLDIKPTNLVLNDSQSERPNNAAEIPVADSASVSVSSNDKRKVSREDIELVQNLIERCLQLYMNRDEVVKTLLNRARIDPGFISLVWQKLEEENADFFRAYYIRLKLKKQIISFNHLLEHQYHLTPKVPLAPAHNGIHPMQNRIHPMPVQSTTYLWDTQSCSSLLFILIPWAFPHPIVTLSMEFQLLEIIFRCG